ncbi:SGNH/GDSL hydrolase family protein [Psychrobacter sp. TAE2020]|uniref:SGNH/GDSL hydrolase family protein n=1 Tax=Psychrobacter sp. TAE2020 TaxID=2846762 RepID=UPI001C113DF6|nr:SGNH/GDSL hydrolase family protein [Psychrobacter sp. TAE2020]MBU5617423.1 SGNH/GDSL hydrolase family protein [Psychrobacter sp. TAE2020]
MVAATNIKSTAKDLLLAPLYLYQGRKVKRNTIRLPEPKGIRCGQVKLTDSTESNSADTDQDTLKIMVVGDSAAAGVGSQTQQQALAGKLIPALQQQALVNKAFAAQFDELNWSVQATTGHTSFDILRRLYILPKPSQPIDVMVLSVGVNDTTSNVAVHQWQQQIEDIIAITKRKFGVREIIFSSLPPMAKMPALPAPLSDFIGAKASKLDKVLRDICAEHQGVSYMDTDFPRMIAEHSNGTPIDIAVMFARDGFHPSSLMYGYWAQQLAELITELLTT